MSVQRIMVIGPMGAGKSTFSRQLGVQLELPVIHLDSLYWRPDWQPPTTAEWRKCVARIAAEERWITDGHYSGTWDLRLPRTNLVIWIDPPRYVFFWRMFKRRIIYHKRTRSDMAPGCPEQLDWEALRHTWAYQSKRPNYAMRLYKSGVPLVRLCSSTEVVQYLKEHRAYPLEWVPSG